MGSTWLREWGMEEKMGNTLSLWHLFRWAIPSDVSAIVYRSKRGCYQLVNTFQHNNASILALFILPIEFNMLTSWMTYLLDRKKRRNNAGKGSPQGIWLRRSWYRGVLTKSLVWGEGRALPVEGNGGCSYRESMEKSGWEGGILEACGENGGM